uniref:Glycosyltransferase 2-like domain-containing protein n=1 Tax=candidate division WWE3 bacterium TaxID=2053526 RepID=A0A7C4XTM0_UNCKA
MSEKKRIVVILASGKADKTTLDRTLSSIFSALRGENTHVIVAIDDYSFEVEPSYIKELSSFYAGRVSSSFAQIKSKGLTFAETYLKAYRLAMGMGEVVIEMDAGGAHDPGQIPALMAKISDGVDCVFSVRRVVRNYPFQRRLVSFVGTWLTNLLLNPDPLKPWRDLTSGFEAFTSKFLAELFAKYPVRNWISPYSAGHLFQTEIRVRALRLNARIAEVDITYGADKKGKKLPAWYLLRAMRGFISLVREFR